MSLAATPRVIFLNPLHEEFSQITIRQTSPFEVDERLLGLGSRE